MLIRKQQKAYANQVGSYIVKGGEYAIAVNHRGMVIPILVLLDGILISILISYTTTPYRKGLV